MSGLPVDFDLSRTRQQHLDDHRVLHRGVNIIPPTAGEDASGRINEALARHRAVLAPGNYRTAATLELGQDTLLDARGVHFYPDDGVTVAAFTSNNAEWRGGYVWGGAVGVTMEGGNNRLSQVNFRGQTDYSVHCLGTYGSIIEQITVAARNVGDISIHPEIGIYLHGDAGDNTTEVRNCWINQCKNAVVVDGTGYGGPQVALTLHKLTFHNNLEHALVFRGNVWNVTVSDPYFESNGMADGGPWANIKIDYVGGGVTVGLRVENGYSNNLAGRENMIIDNNAVRDISVSMFRNGPGGWDLGGGQVVDIYGREWTTNFMYRAPNILVRGPAHGPHVLDYAAYKSDLDALAARVAALEAFP